tara:strand:- start:15 stop:674 length:660 start_codon:yes stop_codon:yes gene_type:complete
MLWLLTSLLFAQEPAMTIIVEASKDIEFYVSPIKIQNRALDISVEAVIDADAAFTYVGHYIKNIKVATGRGGYEPLSLSSYEARVYNERTIQYAWDNCNYKRDPLACAVQNSHYYVETIVTVDDNQLVAKVTIYDSNAQVFLSASTTDDKIVKWIKQQEITIKQEQQQAGLLGGGGSATTIHKPKEELPLKWEIPHSLTDRMIQQMLLGMFVSVKIDMD